LRIGEQEADVDYKLELVLINDQEQG